jgi:hypothetical protein
MGEGNKLNCILVTGGSGLVGKAIEKVRNPQNLKKLI